MQLDVWNDKLPEDKVKYYNRSRMSMELFARKLGIASQVLLNDFWREGYYYDSKHRIVAKRQDLSCPLRNRYMI